MARARLATNRSPSPRGDDRALHQDVPGVRERLGVYSCFLRKRAHDERMYSRSAALAFPSGLSRSPISRSTLMNEHPSKSSR